MKNILIVSDAFLQGGLESYIGEQTEAYKKHGVNSFLACENLNKNKSIPFEKIFTNFNFAPQNGQLASQSILKNSENLSKLCQENHIDYIECQPFWCLIPAAIAAQKNNIPISYTLHGTASGNFIDSSYYEACLLFYICLCFGLDKIFAVSERLANIYSYASKDISISRNGIDTNNLPARKFSITNQFAIASRLDTPKTSVIKNFLPKIYRIKNAKKIHIYGDGDKAQELQNYIEKKNFSDKIKLLGWEPNLPHRLQQEQYDCVFGVGRIITDAISSATPAGILGYGGFTGIVNKNNLNELAKTNFISWDTQNDQLLQEELDRLYKNPKNYIFSKDDLADLDATRNWRTHVEQIRKVKHQDNIIMDLVTDMLANHNNENLLLDANLLPSFQQILTNIDDSQLIYTGLLKTLYEKLTYQHAKQENNLNAELQKIKSSTSWRITKPIRRIKDFLNSI